MRNTQLADKFKVVAAVVPSAGAVANMTPVEVNGTGYDRVMFVLSTGTAAATSTLAFKIQSAATAGGALADVTGAALAALDDTGGSKQYVIDMPVSAAKPFLKVTGAVGTAVMANSTIAILYRGKNYPVSTAYATQIVTL